MRYCRPLLNITLETHSREHGTCLREYFMTKLMPTDDILRLMLLGRGDIFTPDWNLKLIYFLVFSSLMTVVVIFTVVSLRYQFS